jgi:hypothetical protein
VQLSRVSAVPERVGGGLHNGRREGVGNPWPPCPLSAVHANCSLASAFQWVALWLKAAIPEILGSAVAVFLLFCTLQDISHNVPRDHGHPRSGSALVSHVLYAISSSGYVSLVKRKNCAGNQALE